MLFMFQDMAMPHIFVTPGAGTGWNVERNFRQFESHDDRCNFVWVHLDSFLPAEFHCLRSARCSETNGYAVCIRLERLSGKDLNIHKMKVNRVRVTS